MQRNIPNMQFAEFGQFADYGAKDASTMDSMSGSSDDESDSSDENIDTLSENGLMSFVSGVGANYAEQLLREAFCSNNSQESCKTKT